MLTFKEYAEKRGWTETITPISNKIADVGNLVAKKNPRIVPGMTPPNLIKTALTSDAGVEKLVQKDPTAAGAVGAYLGGPQAVKQLARR